MNIKDTLKVLRLLDDQDQLSITNIAVIVVLAKVALSPALALPDILAVVAALGNYSYKKTIASKTPVEQLPVDTDRLNALEEKLDKLTLITGFKQK